MIRDSGLLFLATLYIDNWPKLANESVIWDVQPVCEKLTLELCSMVSGVTSNFGPPPRKETNWALLFLVPTTRPTTATYHNTNTPDRVYIHNLWITMKTKGQGCMQTVV